MRITRILGVLLAGVLGSTLIVWAQTSLKPPCNQFTDPACHPAPPVVTSKASQTVTGDVNVTGNLCVGTGASKRCLSQAVSGDNLVGAGDLTMFKTSLDFTDKVGTETPVKLNVRTFIEGKTGVDPGPVKAVLIRAEMPRNKDLSSILLGYDAPSFWAAHGDVNLLNVNDLNTDQYTITKAVAGEFTICRRSYSAYDLSQQCYNSYKSVYSVVIQIIPTNATNETVLMFSETGNLCPQDSRYCIRISATSYGGKFTVLGFYK